MQSTHLFALFVGLASAMGTEVAAAQTFSSPVSVNANIGSRAFGAALNMNMSGVGSGVNGPETAQFGTDMQCMKNGYYNPTQVAGDLNCFNVSVQQGGPNSDARGIVVNAQNTGLGFSNGIEMVATIANPTDYSVPLYVDDQLADVTSDGGRAGATFNSTIGTGPAGIFINTQGSASWRNLLQATTNGKVAITITGSGSILTSGRVQTAGLVTANSVHAASSPLLDIATSRTLKNTDCGTTMRGLDRSHMTLIVPKGLPVGCQIEVIQANSGAIRFSGQEMLGEHLGTPDHRQVETDGPEAEATLLVDTPATFLLTGDLTDARPEALALVSDLQAFGDHQIASFMK